MAPKKKQEKMSLGTFLGDQSLGSWADEMEDMPVASSGSKTGYGNDSKGSFGSRPGFGDTSGFSERNYLPREQLPLPAKPPYTAHLGNLSFDITSADIQDLFAGCEVTNVRIVEDRVDRKPKGFGYVEFGTLDGLKKALEANGSQFQGRNIRVSVAEPQKDRADVREIGDWTRKGPLPDFPQGQRRPSDRPGYRNNFETGSDVGSDRGGPGPRRNFSFDPGDGKQRDFNNWERKGPLAPAQAPPPHMRDVGRIRSNERNLERRQSPAWGETRSQDGSRPPRREFQERPAPERAPTAAELDNEWRSKMKPDAPSKSPTATPDVSAPSSPVAPAQPTTRPKLNLQKRTVSDANPDAPERAAGDSKSSPFGAARPIDTAARDKEIEEKRIAQRLKKEEEEKERKKKEEEKEKKKAPAERARAEQVGSPGSENGKPTTRETGKDAAKENGSASPAPGKSFEILRRMTEDNVVAEDGEGADDDDAAAAAAAAAAADPDASANGGIDVQLKATELEQQTTAQADSSAAQTTAEAFEDEGWETVPNKSGRKGKPANGARAIAS